MIFILGDSYPDRINNSFHLDEEMDLEQTISTIEHAISKGLKVIEVCNNDYTKCRSLIELKQELRKRKIN